MSTLTKTIGCELADGVLQEIVTRFEDAFSNRIIGYFVEGSFADQTAVATSDLDLVIVFREQFAASEKDAAALLVTALETNSSIELDIELTDEVSLQASADPMFKLGARLVYGMDIRETIPLMAITEWARRRMHAAYWLMVNVFERPRPVRAPLDFPRQGDPFYGYVNRPMRLADGREVLTTRNLIRVTGWIATARLAYEAQEYVVRKRECYSTYQRAIGDEWTSFLAQIDQRCRTDWHYRIPETAEEQQALRAILTKTLAYENHFLDVYRHFLLDELASPQHDAQLAALNFLNQIPFNDTKVIQTAQKLVTAQDVAVRTLAAEVHQRYDKGIGSSTRMLVALTAEACLML